MVKWKVVYTKQAEKDLKLLKRNNLSSQAWRIVEVLQKKPYQNPPRYEKLIGNLTGAYSRRINLKHRIVYQIFDKEKIVKVLRMWTHYDKVSE